MTIRNLNDYLPGSGKINSIGSLALAEDINNDKIITKKILFTIFMIKFIEFLFLPNHYRQMFL